MESSDGEDWCEVCGSPAFETCAMCESIAYCGTEHQKAHWPEHKSSCRPFRVEFSESFGRFLAASRDMKPGEVIFKERPLLMGPRADSAPVCLGCYRPLGSPPPLCSGCGVAPVCGAVCERCGDHSPAECTLMSASRAEAGPLQVAAHSQVVLPLRALALRRATDPAWDQLLRLEAHMAERRDTHIWREHQINTIQVMREHGLLRADEDAELVQRVCGIMDVNTFELRGPPSPVSEVPRRDAERLRGLFLTAALMAHDCVSNTHLAVDDSFQMTVHASVAIAKGEPIFYNYTSVMQGTADRREHLREGKYFLCACDRCSDASELGTHMSSLRCVRCELGLLLASDPDLLSTERRHMHSPANVWKCTQCKHQARGSLVMTAVGQAKILLEDVDRGDPRAMEALLKKLIRTFPPQHFVVVELKQSLVALYRDMILRERNPSRRVLARKAELCEDLLPLLGALEPGISRLKGITLYELHVPLVLIANRQYHAGEVTAPELLGLLQEAEKHLREAVAHLLYEPAQSPEGQLSRAAMQELRALRTNIQDVTAICEQPATKKGSKQRRK